MYMLPSTWDGPQVLHNWNQVNPKRDAPVSSASLKEGDPHTCPQPGLKFLRPFKSLIRGEF